MNYLDTCTPENSKKKNLAFNLVILAVRDLIEEFPSLTKQQVLNEIASLADLAYWLLIEKKR